MPLLTTQGAGVEAYGFYDKPYVAPKYWIGSWGNSGYGSAVEGADGSTYYAGYNTIARVDKNGRLVWAKTDGTATIPNINVAKLYSSFLYVAGDDGTNGYIAKIDISNGSVSFARTLSNFGGLVDIDFDASGNIYVCGAERVATGDFRPTAIVLTSTGTLTTARRFVKATSTVIQGTLTRIRYIPNFNAQGAKVVVSGTDFTNNNPFVMVLNTSLQDDLWEAHIQATGYAYENYILIDSSYNIYLFGHDGGINNYVVLIKINASGTFQWARRITGFFDNFLSGVIDLDQNVQLYSSGYGFLKFNGSGTQLASYGISQYTNIFRVDISTDGTIVGQGNSICKVPYTHNVTAKNLGTTLYPTTFSTTSTSITSTSLSYATGTSLYADAAGSVTSSSNTVAWSDTTPSFTYIYAT